MFAISAALDAWHAAIEAYWAHVSMCDGCTRATAYSLTVRCGDGQVLYHAEQIAYGEYISDQYAGKAVVA